jgi:hypothetical protein
VPVGLLKKFTIPTISGALALRKQDDHNTDSQSDGIVKKIVEEVQTTFSTSYNSLIHAGLYHLTDIPPLIKSI